MVVNKAKKNHSKFRAISVALVTVIALLISLTVLLLPFNTFASRRLQRDYGQPSLASKSLKLDESRSRLRAERLAKSLTFPTVSWEKGRQETQAFLDLHQHIRKSKNYSCHLLLHN